MMPLLGAFPDVEQALCQLLPDAVEGITCDSVPPSAFTSSNLPFARVVCHGGTDDRITDVSRVTIDYFAASRALAAAGAEAIRQYLTQEGGIGPFDVITTDSKPQDIPWNDANTPRRFVVSFRVPTRR